MDVAEVARATWPGKAGAVATFLGLLSLSLSIALWTSRDPALQCPDCNCGEETDPQLGSGSSDGEARMGLGVAVFAMVLVCCIAVTYILERLKVTSFPDCIAYVLFGIFVGTLLRLMGGSSTAGYVLPNQEQLFLFILPPILFQAGYSLDVTDLFNQALSILTFAVAGTVISCLVFGLAMYGIGLSGASYTFSFFEALTWGALISAVDPVATIAVFNALKVNKTLHFLVFGESTLNDAVAIVLFRTFQGFVKAESPPTWYIPIFSFLGIFIGSAVLGCITAVVAALILKHTEMYKNPTLEFSIYLILAYLPYFMCEGLGMSGIMGILTSGMVLAHYAHQNLGRITQISSQQAFKMISFISEMFVFVYLGTALTTFRHHWHPLTIMWAVILTLLSRAANVFPLAALLNQWRADRISSKNQFIMWFSGLRGAIAFALSLNFAGASEETRQVVTSTTLAVVLFTVIVLGGGTFPLLNLLRVEGEFPRAYETVSGGVSDNTNDDIGPTSTDTSIYNRARSLFANGSRLSAFTQIDEEYLKPMLITRTRAGNDATLLRLANAEHTMAPHEMDAVLETEMEEAGNERRIFRLDSHDAERDSLNGG